MPCNLAVTITKAAVTNEQLQKLLTPEVVKTLLESYISKHPNHKGQTPHAFIRGDEVSLPILRYDCRVIIKNGQVRISTPRRNVEEAEALSGELAQLLSLAADKLFAGQVQKALASMGKVSGQTVTVDNQGQKQQARVFTLEV